MVSEKLRAGVIGLGIGKKHVVAYTEHPAVEVVALADPNAQRRAAIAETYAVPHQFDTAEEMFAGCELDLVSIATPNRFHHPLSLAAFEAGCDVLCEKPLALHAEEAREMVQAAKAAGRRLMVNFSYRFHPHAQALKQQVDAGVLGRVYFGRSVWHRRRGIPGFGGWFGQKELAGGGPLIDLGVHRLDLALWWMGFPEPEMVVGSTYNHLGQQKAIEAGTTYDVEDLAAGFIRFKNGATLILEASWIGNIAEAEQMETRLWGTEGGLVHRNIHERYEFEGEIYIERDGCQYDLTPHPPLPPSGDAMHQFVEAIILEKPHPAPGEEGLLVTEILDGLYHSAASGKPFYFE